MVTVMANLNASDFCPSNKDKIMLNWYCYEMALGLETALEQHKEDPSAKKWLKSATIPPMILDITSRLKHMIVTKNLSAATSLQVSPLWIQQHAQDMPRQKCNDIASSLTRAIQVQAKECKNCQMNCLQFKNHPCSLFDDPAYRMPPGASKRGESKAGDSKTSRSRATGHTPGDSSGLVKGVLHPWFDQAQSIVAGYIEAVQTSVKNQTRRVHERVLQAWLDYIKEHAPCPDTAGMRPGRGPGAANAGNVTILDPVDARFYATSLRDFIDSFEFLLEQFSTSTTILKQVPAVLRKFINHVACCYNFDAKVVDKLFDHLETLRAEIIAYVEDNKDFPRESPNRGNSRSMNDEFENLLESPEMLDILQGYMDGRFSKGQFASRISSALGIEMDQATMNAFDKFVIPYADECAKTIKSTGKDIQTLLDEGDSRPTNFDAVTSEIQKIPRDDLSRLLNVTTALYTLAPWKHLKDTQLIGVKDPATGTVWYCSIMGMLGQHLGIMVYPGDTGLASYMALAALRDLPPKERFMRQTGLYLAYESQDYLEDPDILLLELAGLIDKTVRCWPQFRDFTPGYFPWMLNADQVRLLARILSQVLDISRGSAKALRRVPDIQFDHAVLIRERVDRPGQPEAWREDITPVPRTMLVADKYPFLIASRPEMRLDKIPADISARVAAIQQSKKRRDSGGSCLVDIEFVHTLMDSQDGSERPHFPDMLIAVDHASGFVYNSKLVKPDIPKAEIATAFLDVLESCECLPATIHVLSSATAAVIEPVTSLLGIKVVRKDHLRPLGTAILTLKSELEE